MSVNVNLHPNLVDDFGTSSSPGGSNRWQQAAVREQELPRCIPISDEVTTMRSYTRLVDVSSILASRRSLRVYLDPGTGSILLQTIFGVFVGALFGVKLFWHQIKDLFGRLTHVGNNRDKYKERAD
jgi:hypothetical protein